jgi:regulator of cell morphogenesis and NO signaling
MKITEKNVIGELVAADYRTAEVFANHRIDFCCKGNQTIEAVCAKKEIDQGALLAELNEAHHSFESPASDYQSWPLDLLADYIEKKHHRYVTEKTPIIQQYLSKVSKVHGNGNPELLLIAEEFNDCATALAAHMQKEEMILFPFIRKMCTVENGEKFGTMSVENPIDMMKEEHELEGDRFRRITHLSNNYTPPEYACNTYRVAYSLLQEFEKDLHLHIHLENNILFPKALAHQAEQPASCSI